MAENEYWGIERESVRSSEWELRQNTIKEQINLGNLSFEEIKDIPIFLSSNNILYIVNYRNKWISALQKNDTQTIERMRDEIKNVPYLKFSPDNELIFNKLTFPGEEKIDEETIESIQQHIDSGIQAFSKLSEDEFTKQTINQQQMIGVENPIIRDYSKIGYILTTLISEDIKGLSILELGSGSNPVISDYLRDNFGAKATAIDIAISQGGGLKGKCEYLPYDVMDMDKYLSGRCYTACVSHAFFDTPIDLISEEKEQTAQQTAKEIFQKLADVIMPGGLVVCLTNEISLAFNIEAGPMPNFTLIYPSSSVNKIEGIYILQRNI